MDSNYFLLKKAYSLFKNEYQDFCYDLNDIMLWTVSEDEYLTVYRKAENLLNIAIKAKQEQLEIWSSQIRAELLKTEKKAIIIMNASLLSEKNESLKVVIHELAHAYYDSIVSLDPPDGNDELFLFEIGKRMWNEYLAELLTWRILCSNKSLVYSDIERDFK